jgi:hypothetical protein
MFARSLVLLKSIAVVGHTRSFGKLLEEQDGDVPPERTQAPSEASMDRKL